MKKILFSFLLASFFSFPSSAAVTDTEPQPSAIDELLKLLNLWADSYPQCYSDVYEIKETVALIQSLLGSNFDQLFYNYDIF